jgi:hypothetical protein
LVAGPLPGQESTVTVACDDPIVFDISCRLLDGTRYTLLASIISSLAAVAIKSAVFFEWLEPTVFNLLFPSRLVLFSVIVGIVSVVLWAQSAVTSNLDIFVELCWYLQLIAVSVLCFAMCAFRTSNVPNSFRYSASSRSRESGPDPYEEHLLDINNSTAMGALPQIGLDWTEEGMNFGSSASKRRGSFLKGRKATARLWVCSLCLFDNALSKKICTLCGTRKTFRVTLENLGTLNERQRAARRRTNWTRRCDDKGRLEWIRYNPVSKTKDRISQVGLQNLMSFDGRASAMMNVSGSFALRGSNLGSFAHGSNVGSSSFAHNSSSFAQKPHNMSSQQLVPIREKAPGSPAGSNPNHNNSIGSGWAQQSSAYGSHAGSGSFTSSMNIDGSTIGYINQLVSNSFAFVDTTDHVAEDPNQVFIAERWYLEMVSTLGFRDKWTWFIRETNKLRTPPHAGHLEISVRRDRLLEDSVHAICRLPVRHLRKPLRASFKGEPCIDEGGVAREWFELCFEQLFDESRGLFEMTDTDSHSFRINPLSHKVKLARHHTEYFKFAGRMMGIATLGNYTVLPHLALPLLKHILGAPITLGDLSFLDLDLHKNLRWMLENDVELLCLDFTVTHKYLDWMEVVPLRPGGDKIPVTEQNKCQYVNLRLKHDVMDAVKAQLSALLRGLYEVIPRDLMSVFDYQELELLCCGVPVIDVVEWKQNTNYLGEFHPAHM